MIYQLTKVLFYSDGHIHDRPKRQITIDVGGLLPRNRDSRLVRT